MILRWELVGWLVQASTVKPSSPIKWGYLTLILTHAPHTGLITIITGIDRREQCEARFLSKKKRKKEEEAIKILVCDYFPVQEDRRRSYRIIIMIVMWLTVVSPPSVSLFWIIFSGFHPNFTPLRERQEWPMECGATKLKFVIHDQAKSYLNHATSKMLPAPSFYLFIVGCVCDSQHIPMASNSLTYPHGQDMSL